MGEEIQYSRFRKTDYERFEKHLARETELLRDLFEEHAFSTEPLIAGYELEAWLIDVEGQPTPENEILLKSAHNELLSPELARFNIELNIDPQRLKGSVFTDFESALLKQLDQLQTIASHHGCSLMGIGILPTLKDEALTLENLSKLDRYRALNEQVMAQRQGEPIELNIAGHEHLVSRHGDVMLEAAATSFQIHLQVKQDEAVAYYNAAQLVSAPMVAVSANSPFLFGKDLWAETRIPLFEQSVAVGGFAGAHGPIHRVGFGTGYARQSLFECFEENIEHFPILLPVEYDLPEQDLRHLRLHNGTIWRWNRPLIGFDGSGTPHLRIEHRVASTAPSPVDNIANLAFFYGLVHYYACIYDDHIEFDRAKDNFYLAAQHGIDAHVHWDNEDATNMRRLILDRLLIEAETGLRQLFVDDDDIAKYLGIIEARVESGQTGSHWQRQYVETNGCDMKELTLTYLKNQRSNLPVHRWMMEPDHAE